MKTHVMQWDVGEGLFSDGPVPVELEFPSHAATFHLFPITGDLLAELEMEGLGVAELTRGSDALKLSRRLLERVIHHWDGFQDVNGREIPFSEENRRKLAGAGNLVAEIWKVGAELGQVRREAEEGNLES